MATQADIERLQRSLAERVRALRRAAGLTQEQVAELAGIAPQHLSRLETARRLPLLTTLIDLAVALKCDPLDLIGGSQSSVQAERADRIAVALVGLSDDSAEFVERSVLDWIAQLKRLENAP